MPDPGSWIPDKEKGERRKVFKDFFAFVPAGCENYSLQPASLVP
jgi:hypothetical protein